jgi:pyruvate ferredoxin oxidoreductase beta subunit
LAVSGEDDCQCGRLAVETKYYPLYEIRNGKEYRITYHPKNLPVEEYLASQGRFKHLTKKEMKTV